MSKLVEVKQLIDRLEELEEALREGLYGTELGNGKRAENGLCCDEPDRDTMIGLLVGALGEDPPPGYYDSILAEFEDEQAWGHDAKFWQACPHCAPSQGLLSLSF